MYLLVYPNIILGMAILNHVRGGAWGGSYLPGRALFWVTPAVGLLAWTVFAWHAAIIVAVAYFAWGVGPWGRWFALGFKPRVVREKLGWFERGIEAVSGDDDLFAFTLRNMICLLPASVMLHPLFIFLAPVQLGCYYVPWAYFKDFRAIGYAEVATGAAWGVFIVGLSLATTGV